MRRALAVVVAAACNPSVAPATAAPTDLGSSSSPAAAHQGATEGVSAWLSVRGEGATLEEAQASARDQLAAKLIGDAAWLALFPIELHDPNHDAGPIVTQVDGRVRVDLGLSRARAAAIVSQLEMGEPSVAGPPQWHSTLYAFLGGHAAAHVCERRRVLFEADCDPGEHAQADAELQTLAASVTLASEYGGAVPVDAKGKVLASPAIFVLRDGIPVGGVPVAATTTRTVTSISDALGRVDLGLATGASLPTSTGARIDAHALLGPLASSWSPNEPLSLRPRPITLDRFVLVATDKDGTADAVALALRGAGLGDAVGIPSGAMHALLHTAPRDRSGEVKRLAQASHGAVDFVIVAEVSSGFASRMGGSRVWFEARGTLDVLQVWTGESVAHAEAQERANGVGDQRAEEASRTKVIATLVADLKESTALPWPTAARISTR